MVIEELVTRLGFQVDPEGIEKGKSALSGFKKFIGGLALGAGFVTLAKTGVEAAMTMESITAQFTVMTGSAERARDVIADIADFAAHTPFDKIGLSNAGKTLMAFGLEAEKVVPTLRMLGDVAGADQNRLNSLALVFGQIQSTGKLMGQDLLQLINQGFNPLTVMAKATGRSVADLKDLMSQGAISADDVTRAFQIATSEGGLFFGNLEAQSQTLQGRISTLKDNFVTALQNMAEAFLPLMKQMVDWAIAIDWTPIVEGARSVAASIGDISSVVQGLVTWGTRLSPVLLLLFGPAIQAKIAATVTGTRAFGAAQLFVQRAALASTSAVRGQINAMGVLRASMYTATTAAKAFGRGIQAAMNSALGAIGLVLTAVEAVIEGLKYVDEKSHEELAKHFDEQEVEAFRTGKDMYGMSPEGQMEFWEKSLANEKAKLTSLLAASSTATEAEKDAAAKSYKQTEDIWQRQLALYRKVRGIEWESRVTNNKVSSGVAQKITEGDKSVNVNNQFDFEIAAPATKDTRTGLTAADVAQLANQAIDAAFNIRLKSLIVGAM